MNKVRAYGCFQKWAQAGFAGSSSMKEPLFRQKFLSRNTKVAGISSLGSGGPLGRPGSYFNSLVESPECPSCRTSPAAETPAVRSLLVED